MDQWLEFLTQVPEQQLTQNPQVLCQIFTIDLNSPQVSAIQQSLVTSNSTKESITSHVDRLTFLQNEWPRFSLIVKSYLIWCLEINYTNPELSFEFYAQLLTSVQQAFAQQQGYALNDLIKQYIKHIYLLFKNDTLKIEWLASSILKFFNSVRAERDVVPISRKENVIFYANMCARAYFKSNNFTSAKNVFNNMNSLGIKMSQFSLAEQVEYKFWLGRCCIYTMDTDLAYTYLMMAFDDCLPNSPQQVLILDWLCVPSIMMNVFPTYELLSKLPQSTQLILNYLMSVMKSGSLPRDFYEVIRSNEWIRARHLAPILESKFVMLTRRRAFKRLVLLSKSLRLSLDLVCKCFELPTSEKLIAESYCEGLITAGFVKGFIISSNDLITLKPKENMPPVVDVTKNLAAVPSRDKWILE